VENNKKTMLISGMIGIGIGLFISGIILIILMYNGNNKDIPSITNSEHLNKGDIKAESEVEKSKPEDTIIASDVKETKGKEIKEQANEELVKEEIVTIAPEETNIDLATIEIEISETATAGQIAKLLEKDGVIPNASEFLSYIISKDAERILIHGKKTFDKNSDYETALKVLMTYQ